ncbi:MAG: sensor histidine kinase, partial [Myxococcota bacterium]
AAARERADAVATAIRTGTDVRYASEYRMFAASGGVVRLRDTVTVEGRARRCAGVVVEVGERAHEQALLRMAERYRYVARATHDAIYDRDLRTGQVERNRAYMEVYTPPDPPGDAFAGWRALLHPDDRGRTLESLETALRERHTRWSAEYRVRRRDGTYATVLDRASLVYDAGGAPVRMIGVFTDMTTLRTAEEALRVREERFRTLAQGAPVGIFRVDVTGRCSYSNDRLREMLGGSMPAEMESWVARIHEADRERVRAGWIQAARDGIPWQAEYRFVRPDGTVRWFLDQTLPIVGPSGERLGHIGTLTDITAGKRAEEDLQRYREHLEDLVAERTRDLAAANRDLESFSYSVSHDLRAPLRAIDGFGRLLEQECGDTLGDRGKHHLARIRRATHRMALLIDDLLRLSRVTRVPLRCDTVDLSAIAAEVVAELRAQHPERRVQVDIAPGLVARGDHALLRIVIDNLLGNAWKFTARRGEAHIRFWSEEQEGCIVYHVRDDGVGFDASFAPQLFQTFSRLHSQDEFEGTGIGLATVRRVVERHNGNVWAEGTVGGGATVSFTLWQGRRRCGCE